MHLHALGIENRRLTKGNPCDILGKGRNSVIKMGACRQAERKYQYFDRKPDLDNANVGTYFVLEDIPLGVSFFTHVAG